MYFGTSKGRKRSIEKNLKIESREFFFKNHFFRAPWLYNN
jgi:hypothetical protein